LFCTVDAGTESDKCVEQVFIVIEAATAAGK
jgi:hypothetical protein